MTRRVLAALAVTATIAGCGEQATHESSTDKFDKRFATEQAKHPVRERPGPRGCNPTYGGQVVHHYGADCQRYLAKIDRAKRLDACITLAIAGVHDLTAEQCIALPTSTEDLEWLARRNR